MFTYVIYEVICIELCTQGILQILLSNQLQVFLNALSCQCVLPEDQLIVVTATVNL